ncbi:MAG: hypothetical protein ABI686_06700 [Acidobacteriota bacterium]
MIEVYLLLSRSELRSLQTIWRIAAKVEMTSNNQHPEFYADFSIFLFC